MITFIGISDAIAFRWVVEDTADEKSTLVKVMAWYRQATSHYLNQIWLRTVTPYGVTRAPWANTFKSYKANIWYNEKLYFCEV